MDFNDYQSKSRRTAGYPTIGHPVIYPTLGLINEAGEVAGKIKKVFRDKGGEISEETREALKAELGDVL
jgi:NTP pyrophosphatase (non-canonical NTP hydrolase)